MPNKTKKGLREAQRRFIEDIARLLEPWGVPRTAARLYGYLLLMPGPVGLDRMTSELDMSKSSASVAARLLEQFRMVRRSGERGSKRVLYEVADDPGAMLTEQNRLLDALASTLKKGSSAAATGSAADRLKELAAFYLTIRRTLETALRRWSPAGD